MQRQINHAEEGEYIRACLAGDPAGSETFYRRFKPPLKHLLWQRVNDHALAQELAHDALVRAMGALHRFDPQRPLWPWLKTIALNLATDHARRSAHEIPTDNVAIPIPPDDTTDDDILTQALETLPGRQRAALSLRYLNDWTPAEAAAFLGLSRPAFDQLIKRARRKLCIEYRRIRSGVNGLLLFPIERLKAGLLRSARRFQRLNGTTSTGLAESASHLMGAAMVLVLSATGAPISSIPPPASGRAFIAQPLAEEPRGGPERSSSGDVSNSVKPSGGGQEPVNTDSPSDDNGAVIPRDVVEDITDPNRDVNEPEDALLSSFGGGNGDGTLVYGAGSAHCRTVVCPPVLFRSRDGGQTWNRLPAAGLAGADIAIAPGHERRKKIFAMGPGGLQVSSDGGRQFGPAVATGAPLATGSFAISPDFAAGDSSILVGAKTLFRYRDETATLEPYIGTLTGPFEPAFSPFFAEDGLFALGATRLDPVGNLRGTIYVCAANGCTYHLLPRRNQIPKIRMATGPGSSTSLYAFSEDDLFVSSWPQAKFERIHRPGLEAKLTDLAISPDGALIATLASVDPTASDAGVYVSSDEGRTWERAQGQILAGGALKVAAFERRIFIALKEGGVACSADGGRTFRRRCAP